MGVRTAFLEAPSPTPERLTDRDANGVGLWR